jgi:hypothetical protein
MVSVKLSEDGQDYQVSGTLVTAESHPEIWAQIGHRVGPDEAVIIVDSEALRKALSDHKSAKC